MLFRIFLQLSCIFEGKTSLKFIMIKSALNSRFNSDMIGAIASGLCAVHCIATPFLFFAQSCSVTKKCCASGPAWWSAIDHIFIVITFFAVYQSTKNTTKEWLKYAMFLTWVVLTFLMINEKMGFWGIADWGKYLAAGLLIVLHIYNLKYCQCAGDTCCTATPATDDFV